MERPCRRIGEAAGNVAAKVAGVAVVVPVVVLLMFDAAAAAAAAVVDSSYAVGLVRRVG